MILYILQQRTHTHVYDDLTEAPSILRTAWLFRPGMQKFDILVYGFKNVAPNLAHNIDASLHVKHFGDESKSERFTHTENMFLKT